MSISQLSNHQPIAPLNFDYKIFTNILANRLIQILPRLIHKDQRDAGDNTRHTIDLIDLLNKTTHPALILSLDAQKAFDRFSWAFIFATLSTYGFMGPFIEALHALYSQPSSQVQLSSFLLPSFPTRNGCLLSPLLFILCLEPLAEAIRSHSYTVYVGLFCDRVNINCLILLTLTSPHTSLPNLYNLPTNFGLLSGYKVNTSKTDA